MKVAKTNMTSRGGRRAGRFQMLRLTERLGMGRGDWEHCGRGELR